MPRFSVSVAMCLLFLTAAINGACAQNSKGAARVYFKDVNLFDGVKMVGTTNVQIEDGKVSAIGLDILPATDSEMIEGTGKTLVPGLIDCHSHVWFKSQLDQAAVFGVTTEMDMMSSPGAMMMLRSRQKRGKACLLYTSPSPRDRQKSRMPSSA